MTHKSKIKKKYWVLIYIWLIIFLLSFFAIFFDIINPGFFIQPEFLFTFLGVFIGFAITLYTYCATMFDKVNANLEQDFSGDIIKQKKKILKEIYEEIKDDIVFLFIGLLVVVLVTIIKPFFIELKIKTEWYTYIDDALLFSVFILALFAIKDLISVSFKISEYLITKKTKG